MISFPRSCLGICFALGMFLAPCGQSQTSRPGEWGVPFIRNYPQKEYGADSQNWALVQDSRGLIYVGNNHGVLEYDGNRWRLIPTLRRTTVRSLAVDATGRVYVGGVGEIGYLAPDPLGHTVFVDLTTELKPPEQEFSDVWMTASTPQGIVFQSREFLFLRKEGRFQAIKAATTFHLAFAVQGRIFVRQREVGLMELAAGRLSLLPGGGRFAQESIFAMASLSRSADPGNPAPILVGTRNIGLWMLEGEHVEPFRSQADSYLKENSLYCGARMSQGRIALGTLRGGVVLLDLKGRLLGILNRASGLLGDNVKYLYEDRQGCLWMALDAGVAKAECGSPFTLFDEHLGLKGNVWSLQRHQGHLYAATGQGAFVLRQEAGATAQARFQPVSGISSGALALLSLEGDLLVAAGQGVFTIRGETARVIRPSSNVAISLLRSGQNPDRVFVGLQGGLASILRTPGGWRDEGSIPGVRGDIYSLAESKEGELWLGTQTQGVLRVRFPPGWKGACQGGTPIVEPYRDAQGLPDSTQVFVHRVGERVLFGTKLGFFRFDSASGGFRPEASLTDLLPEGARWIRTFAEDSEGRLWIDSQGDQSAHECGLARPQPHGGFRWEPTVARRLAESSVETIYPEVDGTVWFGGPDGLVRYLPDHPQAMTEAIPALVRRVYPQKGDKAEWRPSSTPVFPFRQNALRFEFALPSFEHESANRFRVKLDGYDQAWSDWSPETLREFTNLPEGHYRFRVQGRNVYGQTSAEGVFAFRILPPWYRTWWAYLGYTLVGSGALFLGFRMRTRLLEERNANLQQRVDQATLDLREREKLLASQAGELAAANGHLHSLNERLRNANEEKNQFLGVVVHDLRNPLNGILLAADLIAETDDLSEARIKGQHVARRVLEMNDLIARFLDIAALDAGKLQPEPEVISLEELLAETRERHAPVAERKAIDLHVHWPPAATPLRADPRFLRVVIDNLLSNALKFTPSGRSVSLTAVQTAHATEIAVTDEGPGLTEDDLQKLYGRFVRLSARPTAGEKSTGLGLSIVKKMVEAMGVEILVESQVGVGSTFRVVLPAS